MNIRAQLPATGKITLLTGLHAASPFIWLDKIGNTRSRSAPRKAQGLNRANGGCTFQKISNKESPLSGTSPLCDHFPAPLIRCFFSVSLFPLAFANSSCTLLAVAIRHRIDVPAVTFLVSDAHSVRVRFLLENSRGKFVYTSGEIGVTTSVTNFWRGIEICKIINGLEIW